jgi:NADPH:quinone reductase-like Zn-dependent oxidoreductase
VCSTSKVDLVRSLGARHVIDYTVDDFSRAGELYDVILDTAGNRPLSVLRKALATGGTLVIVGGEGGGKLTGGFQRSLGAPFVSMFSRQKFKGLVSTENYADLEALTSWVEAGSVKPAIDKVYPLPEAPAAVAYMHEGRARGKVVVSIRA